MNRLFRIARVAPVLAGLGLATELPAAPPDRPAVQFFRPEDVQPITRADAEYQKNGMAVHRRVLSRPKDGSVRIDVGHNSYKAGVGADVPYAYSKDELCYIPSGEMWAVSDGVETLFKAGDFMWRPAGAATQRTRVLKDAVTICAFAPARVDDWSHRLPQAEIGKWAGDPAAKPRLVIRNYRDAAPTVRPDQTAFSDGRIVSRRIFSRREHGVAQIDASHNVYKAGVTSGAFTYPHDQLCWMEAGDIEVESDGKTRTVGANSFVWQPEGARIDRLRVVKDAIVICFAAPARGEP